MRIKNKKAVIGDGLVWVVATLLITFILVLFILATGSEAIANIFQDDEYLPGKDKVKSDLILIDELTNLLDTPVKDIENKDSTIYGLIEQWTFDPPNPRHLEIRFEMQEKLKQILNNLVENEDDYYYLYIVRASEEGGFLPPNPIEIEKTTGAHMTNAIIEQAVDFYIYPNNQKIKIRFYIGEDPD